MPTKIITQEVTLSFPHLDEPTQAENGEGPLKYSASLLYAPGADLSAEQAAVMEAATEQFGQKAVQMLKTGALANPFRTDWEKKGYPEGTVFINVRSKQPPGLVDRKNQLVIPGMIDPAYEYTEADKKKIRDVFYPGAKVRVSISAFYYDFEGMKKGVSFGMNHMQFLSDGTRLDSRKAATETFDALPDLEPADISALEQAGA
jgi:hypothetical protein